MRDPGLVAGMTNTVHISVGLVKPSEIAAAHRHTAAAIRLSSKDPQRLHVVEGERFPMFEGDFITSPMDLARSFQRLERTRHVA